MATSQGIQLDQTKRLSSRALGESGPCHLDLRYQKRALSVTLCLQPSGYLLHWPVWAAPCGLYLPRLYRGVPCSASLSLVRHAVATVTGLWPSAALPATTRSRAFSMGVPDQTQHMCSACMEDEPAQGHTEMLMLITEPQLHPHVSPAKFSMEESRACRCTQKTHTRTRLSLKQGPPLGC